MRLRDLSAVLVIGVSHWTPRPAFAEPQPASDQEPKPSPEVSERAVESLEVWVGGNDAEWVARVEGQLSDLAADVYPLGQPLEPEFEQQLAAGKAVRTEGLVVWLSPDSQPPQQLATQGEGAYLYVWFASAQRLYIRRVGPAAQDSDAAGWSATLEIAALALRTAVRAALAGRALGVEAEQLLTPTPHAATRTPPPHQAPRPADRQPTATDSEAKWLVAASASWTFDGKTATGLLSAGPSVRLALASWRASVSGELGMASSIQTPSAKLILRRRFLVGTLGPVVTSSAAANLVPQAYFGAAWFRRDTERQSEQLLASSPATYASPVVGLGLLAELALTEQALLGTELGGLWMPGTPTLLLKWDDGRVAVRHRLWALQPLLRLWLGVGW